MTKPSNLDDADYAAFAWARYRRLMKWMSALALVAIIGVLAALYIETGELRLFQSLMVAGGVGFSVLLMAALMGLVFLSSGTGHDEAVDDSFEKDIKKEHGIDD